MNTVTKQSILAINGAEPSVAARSEEMFHWPIITAEDEAAVLQVMRHGNMSGTDITMQFDG